MRQYKKAIFMGRFQPFHNGHLQVVQEAMKIADQLLIVIGSVDKPPSSKNPFSYIQRYQLIHKALEEAGFKGRFIIEGQKDFDYNESKWIDSVNSRVPDATDVCIIGHSKDDSSYYLKSFPRFKPVEVSNHDGISATPIRYLMYKHIHSWYWNLPSSIKNMVTDLMTTEQFILAREDFNADEASKALWKGSPYPPTFITGDACVVQSGHVLLVKRKFAPGIGLWALPGGYLDKGETINECIIRELYEETNLGIQGRILRRSMGTPEVFDHPDRSGRGRIITHASLIQLEDDKPLPSVKAGDDAREAWWTQISRLTQSNMFEDHYHIIMKLIGQ